MFDDTPTTGYQIIRRDRVPFTQAAVHIVDDPNIGPMARLTYVILTCYVTYGSDTREAYPSQSTIAAKLGVSRQSCSKYLRELRERGLITVVNRYATNGMQTSSLIILNDTEPPAVPVSTDAPTVSTSVDTRCKASLVPGVNEALHEREPLNENQRTTYSASHANDTAPPDGDAEHEQATGNNPTPHTAVGVDLLPAWEPRTGGHIQDTETQATTTPAPDDQTDPPPAPKRSTKRGTRVPDTFPVTDAMRTWAASEGFTNLDLDRVTAEFVDYWRGVSGAKGVKLDWTATWRNRVRQVAAWSSTGARVGVQQQPRAQTVYRNVTDTTEWEWLGMTEAEYREAVADRERRQAELEARKAAEAQRKRDVLARARAYVAGTAASV